MPTTTILTAQARIGVCSEMVEWARKHNYSEGIRHWEHQLAEAEATLARIESDESDKVEA